MYYTMMVMPLERNNQGLKRLRHAAEAATMFNVLCTLVHSLGIVSMRSRLMIYQSPPWLLPSFPLALIESATTGKLFSRAYLQPLRLLWVMAAEERLLSTYDAEKGHFLEIDVEVYLKVKISNFFAECVVIEHLFVHGATCLTSPCQFSVQSVVEKALPSMLLLVMWQRLFSLSSATFLS
ncbi:unnamed protein product [Gongylonema pulchrum]|uniref:Neur_chan_LBD domain-containing protein n=1 Tax=Gongylonema pulchrum TaxID=637853 RepID=A0A183EQR5_9BILA|nr:unnamed protein product [Gongylonema pulchrum]